MTARQVLIAVAIWLFSQPLAAQMQIGMNLAAPTDWGRAIVFKDQMRQSRWLPENHWHIVFWDHPHYPAGRYVCEWTGNDSPIFRKGVNSRDDVLGDMTIATVDYPNKGIAIQPFGDVYDLRFWLPGVQRHGSPFYPPYVESLKPFGVLRFMDWQQTNRSSLTEWGQRRTSRDQSQWASGDTRGVALELCMDLAKEVGADPWLCVPHLATDNFILHMAQLIDERLPAGSTCYLEFGNEFWNTAGGFKCGQWVAEKAAAANEPPAKFYGKQVRRMAGIVRPVLGSRVKIVLCGQAANPWQAKTAAAAAGAGNFDAISCAWYFRLPRDVPHPTDSTVDQILAACQKDIVARLQVEVVLHADLAKSLGVPLICYEGGQHLTVAKTSPIADEVLAAQRHPRMGELYRLALEKCRAAGATLALGYSDVGPWSPGGSWGSREHMMDLDAPKWRALTQ